MKKILFQTVLLKGEAGNSIVSVTHKSTEGRTEVYTITLSDGSTFDYTVVNGNGIASIEKTSTTGLVDTYTITLTDGSTATFDVTNGVVVDSELSTSSTNPLQNGVVTRHINSINEKLETLDEQITNVKNNVNNKQAKLTKVSATIEAGDDTGVIMEEGTSIYYTGFHAPCIAPYTLSRDGYRYYCDVYRVSGGRWQITLRSPMSGAIPVTESIVCRGFALPEGG